MNRRKTCFIWALSLLIAPAMAFQVNGQQKQTESAEKGKPTEQEVKAILEGWGEEPRKVANQFIERHGQPQEASQWRLAWLNGPWWKLTEIVDEALPHNFPEEHTDFFYQTVAYNVPVEKVGELAKLSGSLIVDRVKGELTARSNSEQHTLLLLNVADQVVAGLHTPESGRDVIAQAWLEGQHADMMERLLFSPEVSHPEPGDPGVIYGARPEEKEDDDEDEDDDDDEEDK